MISRLRQHAWIALVVVLFAWTGSCIVEKRRYQLSIKQVWSSLRLCQLEREKYKWSEILLRERATLDGKLAKQVESVEKAKDAMKRIDAVIQGYKEPTDLSLDQMVQEIKQWSEHSSSSSVPLLPLDRPKSLAPTTRPKPASY